MSKMARLAIVIYPAIVLENNTSSYSSERAGLMVHQHVDYDRRSTELPCKTNAKKNLNIFHDVIVNYTE